MDASAGLRHRHPLHPMRPALIFELAVCSIAVNRKGNLLVSADFRGIGIDDVRLPALLFRKARIHAEKIPRKKCGFLAAHAAADLHDDALVVIRVLGQEQDGELRLQRFLFRAQRRKLLFYQVLHLSIIEAVFQHLQVVLDVLACLFVGTELSDDRFQRRMFLVVALPAPHVPEHFGIADEGFQLQIFVLNSLQFLNQNVTPINSQRSLPCVRPPSLLSPPFPHP